MNNVVFPDGLSPEEISFATKILDKPRQFVDHPALNKRNAHIALFKNELDLRDAELAWHSMLVKDTSYVPKNIKRLMTAEEEKQTFLQYNYARMRVAKVCHLSKKRKLTIKQVRDMILWYQIACKIEKNIVIANFGLVFSELRNNNVRFSQHDDYLSNCQVSLLKSIKGFDVSLGWKFSTYCCNALKRNIWNTTRMMGRKSWLSYQPITLNGKSSFEKSSYQDPFNADIDELKFILQNNLARLTDREKHILEQRFNSDLTLEEAGNIINRTKERVRQIERDALRKLRVLYRKMGYSIANSG